VRILRQKERAVQPHPKPKVTQSARCLRAQTGRVPKKGCSEKFCQWCKAHGGPFTTHNTLDCRPFDSNSKPLEAAAGKPSESKKPYKMSGGNEGMAFMQSMLEAYVKSQKKASKSKKCKKRDYDSSDSSDSE
jgi:hypothetical protein